MKNVLNLLWQRWSNPDSPLVREVKQIAVLKQKAAACRAEYAAQNQVTLIKERSGADPITCSREKVEEAEAAYSAALQRWENKQSRQKSR